jgi:hypothetical protein
VGALDEFKAFSDHERGLRKMTGVSCNSPHDDAPDEDDSGRAGKVSACPKCVRKSFGCCVKLCCPVQFGEGFRSRRG